DILDFDTSRAPDTLFHHLGLDNPASMEERISAAEWNKNRAGVFGPVSDTILHFIAGFDSLQQEKEVQVYLDYVQNELRDCIIQLHRRSERWKSLPLPYTISTERADRRGYRSGNFRLTMDQDKVIQLLTGKNLYQDAGVFVRELLQNAIDAILYRATIDPRFEVEDGHIIIRTWIDRNGDSWFRMEDNGIGMDQHTIENYFLKVGRSYYVSDEFQLDKLHYSKKTASGQEDYSPISRFGIGFLSCFMSDPDYNRVQVSTRRYTQDTQSPNPGIRLDVTSLNGYYYLAVEGEQEEWEDNFSPMAHPEDKDRGYRGEAGTTICVRANLYRMGGYRSFQEIVDKYLCYPRFRVEYFGPEGKKVYRTQQELMDAVHNMNPNGPGYEPKKYIHPIPDEVFERLKERTPDTRWNEKPSIILQYYPIDWYSNSGNINGYIIKATLSANTSIEPFKISEKEYYPDAKATFYPESFSNCYCLDYRYSFSHFKFDKEITADNELKIRRMRSAEGTVRIDRKVVNLWVIEDGFITDLSCLCDRNYTGRISYNNVTAEISSDRRNGAVWFYEHGYISSQILFSGPYILNSGMDRSVVSSIQPEALCECALIAHRTDCGDVFQENRFLASDTLQGILDKLHGELYFEYKDENGNILSMQKIREKLAHSNQLKVCVNCSYFNELYHDICIAALQKEFVVCIDTTRRTNEYTIMASTSDEKLGSFPHNMFFPPIENDMPLCVFGRCEYNVDHPFSRWLIQNQVELQTRATGLYNDLLTAMLSYYDTTDAFIAEINAILKQLLNYQNNYFGISDELFLVEADITDFKEEDDDE
nr:hypothetical protein [Clostridia bacterium]